MTFLKKMESFEKYSAGVDEMKKNCLQPNSRAMYNSCIKQYTKFTEKIGSFPLTTQKILSFFEFLRREREYKYSTIQNYLHSFSHFIRMNQATYQNDPTKASEVQEYMKGLMRSMHGGFPPNRKEAVSIEDLDKIAELINIDDATQVRDFACISMMFSGFLRSSEALALKRKNVTLHDGIMQITVESSKTDPDGRRNQVFIKKTDKPHCAYHWMEIYLKTKEFDPEKELFNITYRTMDKKIKKYLMKIGRDSTKYSTHSLRRGGAHEASLNGAQDCAIKSHGRWKSNVYTIYTAISSQEAGESITPLI